MGKTEKAQIKFTTSRQKGKFRICIICLQRYISTVLSKQYEYFNYYDVVHIYRLYNTSNLLRKT